MIAARPSAEQAVANPSSPPGISRISNVGGVGGFAVSDHRTGIGVDSGPALPNAYLPSSEIEYPWLWDAPASPSPTTCPETDALAPAKTRPNETPDRNPIGMTT